MATSTGRTRCVTCSKEKVTSKCAGCLDDFCSDHLADHRQLLAKQLDEIKVNRDVVRQTLTEQTNEPQKHPLVKQIDEWERDSVNKIRQAAKEAKQVLLKHTTKHITQLEDKLNKLTNQLRENRRENDVTETHLDRWKDELSQLSEQLIKPRNITIRHDSAPLVTKIYVDVSSALTYIPNISTNAKWAPNAVTVAGGNVFGDGLNQLSNPCGLHVADDQTVYVADQNNHRIVEWKSGATSCRIVAGGNGPGNRNDQLNHPVDMIIDEESDSLVICDYSNKRVVQWPLRNGTRGQTIISNIHCRGLTMDNDGYLYVSDHSKHEVRRWKIGDTNGTVVAGSNGEGNRLDQLNGPTYIFVDQDHSVYVSDGNNHRVMKWLKGAKEGSVVAGGQGVGNGLTQLSAPRGAFIDQLGTIYVADSDNHRVMRWPKGATQGSVVAGGNGQGGGPHQFSRPFSLSFDQQGNLYVVDVYNHRVQKFTIDSSSNT